MNIRSKPRNTEESERTSRTKSGLKKQSQTTTKQLPMNYVESTLNMRIIISLSNCAGILNVWQYQPKGKNTLTRA